MVDYKDDTYTPISIAIIVEGFADISNVVYPATIQANEPFAITYTVSNLGNLDMIWAGLYENAVTETPVTPPGGTTTYWSLLLDGGSHYDATINYPNGITSSITGYELRAGHEIFG